MKLELKKYSPLPAVLALVSVMYPLLYFFRALDDNRLTSWETAFQFVSPLPLFLYLIAGVCSAYALSRFSFPEKYPRAFIFFLASTASLLFWREPEVIIDASRYFTQAKHLELYGIGYFLREWGRSIPAWTDMPLVPFLYGLLFKFFGENRHIIQGLNTLFFSLTAVINFQIGKKLWNEKIGLYGGIIFLGVPYLYCQIPLMLVDIACMFFLSLTVLTFLQALEKNDKRSIALAAVSFLLAWHAKYSMCLMLSVTGIVYGVRLLDQRGMERRRVLLRGGAVLAGAGALIILCFIAWQGVMLSQMWLLMEYQRPGLSRWGESFLSTFFFQVHPFLTLSALASVFVAIRRKDLKFMIICWLLLLVVALRIKRIRYVLMVFPMLSLMAAYGLSYLTHKKTALFISLTVALTSLIIAHALYMPFLERVSMKNLEEAGRFLESIKGNDIEVFTFLPDSPVANIAVAVPLLDLFTHKRINYSYQPDLSKVPVDVRESALRFTWEFKNPLYYENIAQHSGPSAFVLISGKKDFPLPESIKTRVKDCRKTRLFQTTEGIFEYQTFVTVLY